MLEQISNAEVFFFVTCGLSITDAYKAKMEKVLIPFINDNCEYGGLFMCQAKMSYEQQLKFRMSYPDSYNKLEQMFNIGETHPDDSDFENLDKFVEHEFMT